VLTGLSAGIDPFRTILDQASDAKVTHLLFDNVGSHGRTKRDAQVFRDRMARLNPIARDDLGLPLIAVGSNLDAVLGMDFQLRHTIRNAAIAMPFQWLAGEPVSTVPENGKCPQKSRPRSGFEWLATRFAGMRHHQWSRRLRAPRWPPRRCQ